MRALAGSNRNLLDYLLEEILQQQPADRQLFLLQTSILDRLSGAACDAITGRTDSRTVLHDLDKANLFIIPLDEDRQWYRYHRLFADVLHQRLQQTRPNDVAVLHRRASAWYAQHGDMPSAIEHALAAGEDDAAADLIEQAAEATLMRGEVTTLLKWIERGVAEAIEHALTAGDTDRAAQLIEKAAEADVDARRSDHVVEMDRSTARRCRACPIGPVRLSRVGAAAGRPPHGVDPRALEGCRSRGGDRSGAGGSRGHSRHAGVHDGRCARTRSIWRSRR